MNEVAVIYVNQTNHILAALQQSARLPDLEKLVGPDGIHISGIRGILPPLVAGYGAGTTQLERFVVPTTEIGLKLLPRLDDVFVRPHVYLIDLTSAVALPLPGPYRDVNVALHLTNVTLGSTDPLHPASLTFPVDTKVFIQVEGPDPTDRRVMRGLFPAGQHSPFAFQLTVEPGGPLAPITPGKRYFILVLIEGKSPDARTVDL